MRCSLGTLILGGFVILSMCWARAVVGQDIEEANTIGRSNNAIVQVPHSHEQFGVGCGQLPRQLQSKVAIRDRALEKLWKQARRQDVKSSLKASGVVSRQRRWTAGQIVTVAFRGGLYETQCRIEEVAGRWAQHANIFLDFGHVPDRKTFRSWGEADEEFQADIRICFDATGNWSLIGSDSCNPAVIKPHQASMCFEGMDKYLPSGWERTVMHEFGHALGLLHEHQSPAATCKFRWEDDPGYEDTQDATGRFIPDAEGRWPGIYTYLMGPPFRWTRCEVESNMAALAKELEPEVVTPLDAKSVMMYGFPAWFFEDREKSPCFVAGNRQPILSAGDIKAIKELYPSKRQDLVAMVNERKQIALQFLTLKDELQGRQWQRSREAYLDFAYDPFLVESQVHEPRTRSEKLTVMVAEQKTRSVPYTVQVPEQKTRMVAYTTTVPEIRTKSLTYVAKVP